MCVKESLRCGKWVRDTNELNITGYFINPSRQLVKAKEYT